MPRTLPRILLIMGLCFTLPHTVFAQDRAEELQALADGLFPGNYWIEISGALSNEGVAEQRAPNSGWDGDHSQSIPGVSDNSYLSERTSDYILLLEPTVQDPSHDEDIAWARLDLTFVNVVGSSLHVYPIVTQQLAENLPVDLPYASLVFNMPSSGTRGFNATRVDGSVYVEERTVGDVTDRIISFEFTAQSDQKQQVHVRGAAYNRDVETIRILEPQPNSTSLEFTGAATAEQLDTFVVRRQPTSDGRVRLLIDAAFVGRLKSEPALTQDFQLRIEATFDEVPTCAGDGVVGGGRAGTDLVIGGILLNGAPLRIDRINLSRPSPYLCYADEAHTTLTGIIAISGDAIETLDYLSFYLTYKAVPVADIPA